MKQINLPWLIALRGHLRNKHHDQLESWLVDHIASLIPSDPTDYWLMCIAEDTCDAGHVHHDIALWLLNDFDLTTVIVSEEHYDLDSSNVETTFDTSIASHPVDTLSGMQLMTVSAPGGTLMEVGLAIMIANPGFTGHTEPIAIGHSEMAMHGVSISPATITIMGNTERVQDFRIFRDAILVKQRMLAKNRKKFRKLKHDNHTDDLLRTLTQRQLAEAHDPVANIDSAQPIIFEDDIPIDPTEI